MMRSLESSAPTTHAVVEVSDGYPRDALLQALGSIGVPFSDDAGLVEQNAHPVWIGDATTNSTYDIRVWTKGRTRDANNPFADRTVRHVLGCDPDLEPELLQSTMTQLVSRDAIIFHQMLGDNSSVWEVEVTESTDKNQIVEDAGDFFRDNACSERLVAVMQTTVDEMVTNALYNAPVQDGRRLFASRARTETIQSPNPVTLKCGCDDEHVTIMVRDEYGSLTAEEVIDNLFRCYRFDQQQVDEKFGGAGLGFFLLLRNANRFVINIEPGQFTEMIVQRKRNQRFRAFSQSSPSLNLCVVGDVERGSRRAFRRFPVHWQAQCESEDGQRYAVTVRDVSEFGAFLAIEDPAFPKLKRGSKIKIYLSEDLSEQQQALSATLRWTGENRHHRCEGMGIEFEQRLPLNNLLQSPE